MQTHEKFYFICEKWLALDKEDCLIERVLPISTHKDQLELKYLLSRQTKKKLSDGHLWFSIFARPVQSSFTRLDRLTCCFVLLSITMLMNIMYYGMDTSAQQDGLNIGPYLNLTLQQFSVGVITNLIVFPPNLLLVQLFKRSEMRNKSHRKSGKKRKLIFPWWFKIIAYILSFVFAAVSIFFVVIKGIEFGSEKVAKWLTSVIFSLFSSILLTQPIQVNSKVYKNKKLVNSWFKSYF